MQKKILVLDDDPMALLVLESTLTDKGYTVSCIMKTDLLNSELKSFAPDLIILDIRLDDSDGRDICNELKLANETRHIPIIMLTGLSHEEISEKDCAADAIIGKSSDSKNLLHTVSDLLAG